MSVSLHYHLCTGLKKSAHTSEVATQLQKARQIISSSFSYIGHIAVCKILLLNKFCFEGNASLTALHIKIFTAFDTFISHIFFQPPLLTLLHSDVSFFSSLSIYLQIICTSNWKLSIHCSLPSLTVI